ncbi:MAG: hypothetical protein ABI051_11075 [Vicinamibacterales bacterium]
MARGAACAFVVLVLLAAASAQELPVLHVTVLALNTEGRVVPVARHALLISDNPATAAPRRAITSSAGTTQLRLRPGQYVVESEAPLVLNGRTYEWALTVEVPAGRDTTLELTPSNATVGRVTADLERDEAAKARTPVSLAAAIFDKWQASAFALWTPYLHAAGVLVDDRGLVATSLRAIGTSMSVEVQLSPALKVTGTVVLADRVTDVALIRVHPSATAGLRAVVLACDGGGAAVAESDRYLIDVPLGGAKTITPRPVVSADSGGGPVFASDGRAIGVASSVHDESLRDTGDIRLVSAEGICSALASVRTSLDATPPPDLAHLPVEPAPAGPARSERAAAPGRVFSLTPYQFSTSDFDVTFLTPVVLAAAQAKRDWTGGRAQELNGRRVATDFDNWSDYVMTAPPVLLVRVTPRRVEGFWTKVARGAASTQGAQIPPIKRLRPGFSQMQLVCGNALVTPVHPFRLQARITETEAIEEGLYVFTPDAIGPHCDTVSIVLSSVKDPNKMEKRTVDPPIVKRVWDDFAGLRATGP